jgi:glycosyltransferase involved in cell wall biosynthesis
MNLLYLAKPRFGGWVSFTAHLALQMNWDLYKVTNTDEKKSRPFGYGVNYKNIKIGSLPSKILITAIDKNFYKYLDDIPDKTYIVIHDPTELKKELLPHLVRFRIITIRKTVKTLLKNKYDLKSLFLPHPFYPYPKTDKIKNGICSVSRIDYDKHTDILIEANKQLENPIDIYGAKNDLYVYRKLGDTLDPYYKGCFKKDFVELDKILSSYKFMIDMSAIKGDGAGSQYTFLEAIYHGNILILSKSWTGAGADTEFIHEHNCLIVSTPEDIKSVIEDEQLDKKVEFIISNAEKILDKHLQINWDFNS